MGQPPVRVRATVRPVVARSRSHRFTALAVLSLLSLGSVGACFDSDEVFSAPGTTTTGDPVTTSTGGDSSTTSILDPTTGEPDVSCRDAVVCIQDCASDLITMPTIEPDLGCFLDCEEQLTVREAYHLLRLANCAAEVCEASDACKSGEEGTSSSSGGDPPLVDPCLACVFGTMLDESPTECVEFHELCNEEMVE